mgnify:CR=1 FL=1
MYNNYIFIVVMYSLTGYVHKYFLGYNKFRQKGGNHMNTIITIGRQFGSGGHEIGEKWRNIMESNAMIRNFFPGLRKRVVL